MAFFRPNPVIPPAQAGETLGDIGRGVTTNVAQNIGAGIQNRAANINDRGANLAARGFNKRSQWLQNKGNKINQRGQNVSGWQPSGLIPRAIDAVGNTAAGVGNAALNLSGNWAQTNRENADQYKDINPEAWANVEQTAAPTDRTSGLGQPTGLGQGLDTMYTDAVNGKLGATDNAYLSGQNKLIDDQTTIDMANAREQLGASNNVWGGRQDQSMTNLQQNALSQKNALITDQLQKRVTEAGARDNANQENLRQNTGLGMTEDMNNYNRSADYAFGDAGQNLAERRQGLSAAQVGLNGWQTLKKNRQSEGALGLGANMIGRTL
jgi:hypothetical protein